MGHVYPGDIRDKYPIACHHSDVNALLITPTRVVSHALYVLLNSRPHGSNGAISTPQVRSISHTTVITVSNTGKPCSFSQWDTRYAALRFVQNVVISAHSGPLPRLPCHIHLLGALVLPRHSIRSPVDTAGANKLFSDTRRGGGAQNDVHQWTART